MRLMPRPAGKHPEDGGGASMLGLIENSPLFLTDLIAFR